MNEVFARLVGALGGITEPRTITIQMTVPMDTLNRGMVAASRLRKEDQESEFMNYVVPRTGYLNMKLIDFDVPE